ncbi:17684_t:CDS:1, partial [Dentiscutata erythropus]
MESYKCRFHLKNAHLKKCKKKNKQFNETAPAPIEEASVEFNEKSNKETWTIIY